MTSIAGARRAARMAVAEDIDRLNARGDQGHEAIETLRDRLRRAIERIDAAEERTVAAEGRITAAEAALVALRARVKAIEDRLADPSPRPRGV